VVVIVVVVVVVVVVVTVADQQLLSFHRCLTINDVPRVEYFSTLKEELFLWHAIAEAQIPTSSFRLLTKVILKTNY
jgi:hypothetical protein